VRQPLSSRNLVLIDKRFSGPDTAQNRRQEKQTAEHFYDSRKPHDETSLKEFFSEFFVSSDAVKTCASFCVCASRFYVFFSSFRKA
jgi:hypothetical protein